MPQARTLAVAWGTAKVTQVKREKIGRSYDIEFYFDGQPIRGNIMIDKDGVKVGDSILIRVSNKSPREHFVFAGSVEKYGY